MDMNEKPLNRDAAIGFLLGIGAAISAALGMVLVRVYPPPENVRSALYNSVTIAATLLYLISMGLAPFAVIKGFLALRSKKLLVEGESGTLLAKLAVGLGILTMLGPVLGMLFALGLGIAFKAFGVIG